MKLSTRLRNVIIFSAITLFLARSALAQENEALTLNLQNADISALVETVSEITGKNFVIDPRVKGKITIVSSQPTHPDQLYDLFLSVLRVHGFAAVNQGKIIKIIPDGSAKQNDIPTIGSGQTRSSDEVATLILALQNVSAKELVPVLRPLLPQSAHLAAHQESNVLIAADSARNLQRLGKIVRRIDQDNNRAIEVIRLQFANAADLMQVLAPTLNSNSAKSRNSSVEPLKLVADERTNSLLLSGDRKRRVELRALISHLDTPAEQPGDTEVIYLRYAVASKLVPILQKLGNQLGASESERQKSNSRQNSASSPQFVIEADDSTNAIIVQASPRRIKALKSVIQKLDVRRAQVLVEGIIAEVAYDRSLELGVQWKSSVDSDGLFGGSSLPGAVSQSAIEDFSDNPLALANGLTLGYFRGGDLRGLLQAIVGDGYKNVLSTPTLMTLDNEEAEIVVGQNVPFITGQFTNNTTSPDNPFQTIERKDVGIVLKIKPQINEGDSVRLKIEQEISSIDQTATGSDLITDKRSIKTNVLVDDGEIIVLGGLLEDDSRENVAKVPILGDIPLLGALFKRNSDSRKKTNLMIFLKPQIVRDARTGSNLTLEKYNYLRSQQQTLNRGNLVSMLKSKRPQLPDIKKKRPELPSPSSTSLSDSDEDAEDEENF